MFYYIKIIKKKRIVISKQHDIELQKQVIKIELKFRGSA